MAPKQAKKASTKKASTKTASTKKASTKKASTKKASTKKAAGKKRPLVVPGVVVGRVERVRLPEWGLSDLKAKVDTGARTSSLHVDEIQSLGRGQVRFAVVTGEHARKWAVAKVSRVTKVRSSNGQLEERIFVTTLLELGPVTKRIELSLTGRADMRYRMLLGRLALEGEFIVDVSQRFAAGRMITHGWRLRDSSFFRHRPEPA